MSCELYASKPPHFQQIIVFSIYFTLSLISLSNLQSQTAFSRDEYSILALLSSM
jgi:hypothetical protein